MANSVYIATSLDGFIADKNGSIDWLINIPNPDNSDFGFAEFLARVDALVMGRKTYETVLGFTEWPYPKPVFVWSQTLSTVPSSLEGKVEFVKGSPHEIVQHLRVRGYSNLYIDGGQTVQSFMETGLIDEFILTLIPIVLGGGTSLYQSSTLRKSFQLVASETLSIGAVKMTMRKMEK